MGSAMVAGVLPATVHQGPYAARITRDPRDVTEAQRLRYRVFAEELGARIDGGPDADEFDEHCDHLVVTHTPTGELVGTYRLLQPGRSAGLYSQSEFAMDALTSLRSELVEAGRSCVHPEHRSGAVITLMWSLLAQYAQASGVNYLAGCASVPLADGGHAASTMLALTERHSAPEEFGVRPLCPWQGRPVTRPSYAHLPPLLRGYLRLGAWVCGPPAYDPAFEVADFFVLLQWNRVDARYLRYFLPTQGGNR